MPGVQADLIVRDRATGTINKVSGSIRRMEQTTVAGSKRMNAGLAAVKQHWLGISVAVAGAAIALTRMWASAKRGATFEEDMGRINKQLTKFDTTAERLIPRMIQVANGQLSMAQAAGLASRALVAGLSTEGIETFIKLADTLGDVMGISLPEAFEQLTKAAATGRGTILKQAGIYLNLELEVDKLAKSLGVTTTQITEETKALIAQRKIMEQAGAVIAKFATDQVSAIDKMTAVEARFDDITLRAGLFFKAVVVGSFDAIEALKKFRDEASEATGIQFDVFAAPERIIAARGRSSARPSIERFTKAIAQMRRDQEAAVKAAVLAAQAVEQERRGLIISTAAREQQKAFGEIRLTLEKAITAEITRQQQIIQGVASGRAAFERERADIRFQRLDPEEKLQSLRRQVSNAGEDAKKLQRILRQTEQLGELPGAERLVRLLLERIPTAFDRTERAAEDATARLKQLLPPVRDATLEVHDAVEAVGIVMQQVSPSNSPFLSTLDELTSKARAAADMVRQVLIAMQGAGEIGGGGGGDGFASGSSRIRRTGLALLHRGEAVIPASKNFLNPAISRMERGERLARLASGRLPSFEHGTTSFPGGVVGGTGAALSGFGSLSGLELLRSGGRIPNRFFFDPSERLRFLQEQYERLINEMNVFRFRTRPENFLFTLGRQRVQAEGQTANAAFVGLSAQLQRSIQAAQREVDQRDTGIVGRAGGGVTINISIGGGIGTSPDLIARAVRDAVLPELRRLTQTGGQRLF